MRLPSGTLSFLRVNRSEDGGQIFSKPFLSLHPPAPHHPVLVYTEYFPLRAVLWHLECLCEPSQEGTGLSISLSLTPGTRPGTQQAVRK